MTTLNISLPEAMRAFIEEQTKGGGYSTASEYLRSLIREDQKRQAQQRLETLLLAGLESGKAEKLTPDDWADIKNQVRQRLGEDQNRARLRSRADLRPSIRAGAPRPRVLNARAPLGIMLHYA